MTEVLSVLFPYIVFFYLIDCFKYVHKYNLLIENLYGSNFNLKKEGFHFVGLSPIGSNFFSYDYPFCLTTKGLYLLKTEPIYRIDLFQSDDFLYIPYQDLSEIQAEGENIKLNNTRTIKTHNNITARHLACLIQELRNLDLAKRYERIRSFLLKTLDFEEIKKRISSYDNQTYYLKLSCSFMFINTFLVIPLILYFPLYLYINIKIIVILIFFSYFAIFMLTLFCHKKMFINEKYHRLKLILTLILYPVSAIHILSHLTKDYFSNFDYLALAAVLLPSNVFKEIVRKEIFRIEYIKDHIDSKDWIEYWDLKKSSINRLIEQRGLSLENIKVMPQKKEDQAISYCPYCLCEFTKQLSECPDCMVKVNTYS